MNEVQRIILVAAAIYACMQLTAIRLHLLWLREHLGDRGVGR